MHKILVNLQIFDYFIIIFTYPPTKKEKGTSDRCANGLLLHCIQRQLCYSYANILILFDKFNIYCAQVSMKLVIFHENYDKNVL